MGTKAKSRSSQKKSRSPAKIKSLSSEEKTTLCEKARCGELDLQACLAQIKGLVPNDPSLHEVWFRMLDLNQNGKLEGKCTDKEAKWEKTLRALNKLEDREARWENTLHTLDRLDAAVQKMQAMNSRQGIAPQQETPESKVGISSPHPPVQLSIEPAQITRSIAPDLPISASDNTNSLPIGAPVEIVSPSDETKGIELNEESDGSIWPDPEYLQAAIDSDS